MIRVRPRTFHRVLMGISNLNGACFVAFFYYLLPICVPLHAREKWSRSFCTGLLLHDFDWPEKAFENLLISILRTNCPKRVRNSIEYEELSFPI